MKKILYNLKERFIKWVINNILIPYNYIEESTLYRELSEVKEEIWESAVSQNDFDNLDYDIEEMRNNTDDHENRIDKLEESIEGIGGIDDTIDSIEEELEEYDELYQRLKTVITAKENVKPEDVVKEFIKFVLEMEEED